MFCPPQVHQHLKQQWGAAQLSPSGPGRHGAEDRSPPSFRGLCRSLLPSLLPRLPSEEHLFSAAFGQPLQTSAPGLHSHLPRSACSSLARRYPCSPSMSAPWGKGFLPDSFPVPFQVPRTVPGAETLRANTCPRKLLEVGRPPPAALAPDKQWGAGASFWKMTCFYCYVCSGF